MKQFTDNEIFNSATTIILDDAQTNRMLELIKAKDHCGIGVLVCEYVSDDILSSRARFIETLKVVLGASYGQ